MNIKYLVSHTVVILSINTALCALSSQALLLLPHNTVPMDIPGCAPPCPCRCIENFLAIMSNMEEHITQAPNTEYKKSWILILARAKQMPEPSKTQDLGSWNYCPWGANSFQTWSHTAYYLLNSDNKEFVLGSIRDLHGELYLKKKKKRSTLLFSREKVAIWIY